MNEAPQVNEPNESITSVETPEVIEQSDEPMEGYDPSEVNQASKTLDVTSSKDLSSNVKTVGNPDLFSVLSKASNEEEGWMKSTKVMPINSLGVLVQVTTQQRNSDGSYSIAEALEFVPGARIGTSGGNKCLIR